MIEKDPPSFPGKFDEPHSEVVSDAEILEELNQPSPIPEKGWLSQKPLPGSLNSPAFLVALCFLCSGLYWWSPWADQLVAPRGEVFQRPWVLLSSILVHSDISHLASNSGLFLLFGWLLRAFIGRLAFPFLALIAGVVTQILSLITYHDRVVLLGASGMVYAMGGMWLCYYLFCEHRLSIASKVFRILGFAMIVLLPSQIQAQVSYRAHAIGFIVGFAIAGMSMAWVKRQLQERASAQLDL
ncbi:MAG: rhomboid family intramembrane serine protease [Oligoflexus sp.]